MLIKCLVDDDGRHCGEKATCIITCIDDKGISFANTSINSLIEVGRVKTIVTLFYMGTTTKDAYTNESFDKIQNLIEEKLQDCWFLCWQQFW